MARRTERDGAFFEIDENQLDKEWIGQPRLFFDAATQAAEARLTWEEAKLDLSVIESDLGLAVRDDPKAYNVEKVTEKIVEAVTIQQEEYQKAVKKVAKAKHELDLCQAAVQALDHKKHALENLVRLHGQNYFSKPTAGETGKEVADELTKSATRRRRRRRLSSDTD